MVRRPLSFLLMPFAALALTSCVTVYPDLNQSRSPCRSDPGGWCDFTRAIAVESYAYAMLSSNAYGDEEAYTTLPVGFVQRESVDDTDTGIGYTLFDRFAVGEGGVRGALKARIIAFRGTDFGSTSDILRGSFGTGQIEKARALFERLRDAEPRVPVVVTGHSLGGALATQISIEYPEAKAFAFNTSPLVGDTPTLNDTNRVAVSERGEFLRLLRRYRAPLAADQLVINCSPSAGAGTKHGIRLLGDCLTWIAAYDDANAAALIEPNAIKKPEIECGEAAKAHPGVIAASARASLPPCSHQPAAPATDADA